MKLDAAGLSLDGEAPPDVELPIEPENDRDDKTLRQASQGADRVVDFRAPHDKEG
jgi:hypothetical protein